MTESIVNPFLASIYLRYRRSALKRFKTSKKLYPNKTDHRRVRGQAVQNTSNCEQAPPDICTAFSEPTITLTRRPKPRRAYAHGAKHS